MCIELYNPLSIVADHAVVVVVVLPVAEVRVVLPVAEHCGLTRMAMTM